MPSDRQTMRSVAAQCQEWGTGKAMPSLLRVRGRQAQGAIGAGDGLGWEQHASAPMIHQQQQQHQRQGVAGEGGLCVVGRRGPCDRNNTGACADEEVLAIHGVQEEVLAVQHDEWETQSVCAPPASQSQQSGRQGLAGGLIWAAGGEADLSLGGVRDASRVSSRAATAAAAVLDPVTSICEQAKEQVRAQH